MKLQAVLLFTLTFSQIPAYAQQYAVQDECYRNVEQYLPGYSTPDGRYVRGQIRTRRESIPCGGGNYPVQPQYPPQYPQQYPQQYPPQSSVPRCDRNRTIFNGLAGGGIAAALSKPNAYLWSIPLGLALGVSSSRIGCR